MIDLEGYTTEELMTYYNGNEVKSIVDAYCEYLCCDNPDHDGKQWDWLYEAVANELQYRMEEFEQEDNDYFKRGD